MDEECPKKSGQKAGLPRVAYHFNGVGQQLRKHGHGVWNVDNLQQLHVSSREIGGMQAALKDFVKALHAAEAGRFSHCPCQLHQDMQGTEWHVTYLVVFDDFCDEVAGVEKIPNNRHAHAQHQDVGVL